MGDANEYEDAKIPQVDDEPMPEAPRHQAPEHPAYVRQRPAHRSVGTVSDFDDSGKEAPTSIAHDSGYTNRAGRANCRRGRGGDQSRPR